MLDRDQFRRPAPIIVVDGNPADRQWLVGVLTEAGYQVRPYPDGASALTAAWAEPPALILLDIDRYNIDSYQVCRRLKADERTAPTPVIFTGASDVLTHSHHREKLFAAGGLDYILKPFQVDEVLTKIERHLRWQMMGPQAVIERQPIEVELPAAYPEPDSEDYTAKIKLAMDKLQQEVAERNQIAETVRLTHNLTDLMTDALYWIDREARIIDVNDTACRMLGYTHEEFTQMSLRDIDATISPEHEITVLSQVQQLGTLTFETQHRTKDGRLIPVEVTTNTIEFDQYQISYAFVRDITQRKQIEETLQLTRFTVESVADAVYWITPEGQIVDVNPAACAMLGYTREEMLNLTLFDIDPGVTPDWWDIAWNLIKDKGKRWLETTHRAKDGRLIPVEAIANFIQFGDRKFNCAIARDISQRKAVEMTLRENEERLRQAIRVAGIGIFDHDHLANAVYMSPEYRMMWGWDPDDEGIFVEGIDQIHPDDRERLTKAVLRAHDPEGAGFFDIEYRIVRRDGAVRWLSVRSQTFFEGEGDKRRPVRTVGAIIDITAAKQAQATQAKLEEQLRQAQKLESIGQLAGGIAHDFNNLLVPIIGYTELAQMQLSANSKIYNDLEKIRNAAERSASLTRQLLAFSRRQVLEVKVLDLNEVIRGFQEMLWRLISEAITVQVLLASGPGLIKADRSQIEQILLNLSINARDAMPNGGELIIETDNVYLDEAYAQTHAEVQPGHYVMLCLSDTGHGMDSDTQKQIFEPFFTTKAQGRGVGLGLAMVFGIVKQHQGHIWLYSEVSKGTTFKIYLPRTEAVRSTAAVAPTPTSVYGDETVLVVEDEPMVRKLACETLEAYGYTVIETASPADAIQFVATYEAIIHLLLTDVIMPAMNGRQLYETLAVMRPDLKVLYMSGYTDNVIVHHGVLDEGVNFLQKPFTIRSLTERVRTVLQAPL